LLKKGYYSGNLRFVAGLGAQQLADLKGTLVKRDTQAICKVFQKKKAPEVQFMQFLCNLKDSVIPSC
jgi:hypothetical protein